MTRLFGTSELDGLSSQLRDAFSKPEATFVETQAVQPLTPYLEFLGEFYRDTLVEYSSAGQDEYCLRPDLTLAIARDVAGGALEPGRLFYDDLVFRGARRVRLEEAGAFAPLQRQIGIEVFGAQADDAALLLQTVAALKSVGVEDIRIHVSDVALVCDLIDGFDLHANWKQRLKRTVSMPDAFQRVKSAAMGGGGAPSNLSQALSGLSDEAARAAVEDIFAMSGLKEIGSRSMADVADRLVAKAAEAREPLKVSDADLLASLMGVEGPFGTALNEFGDLLADRSKPERIGALEALAQDLEAGGLALDSIRFDADLSRHLSYYDGFIFEIFDASGEVFLGGGGRYDGLVSSLSNGLRSVPAIGAMLRPDRILSIL
ncbi:MAG: ATP phosphoribosyltransferase regulatory subunit [Pseudomonadota bacterium]